MAMHDLIIHCHAKLALILGIFEGFLGISMLVFAILVTKNSSDIIWLNPYVPAAICIVAGIVGILVGIKKNRCAMTSFLVYNVILTIIQVVFSVIAWGVVVVLRSIEGHIGKYCLYDVQRKVCVCNVLGSQHDFAGLGECHTITKLVTWMTVLVSITSFSAVLALSIAIFGCVAVCCTQSVTMEPIVIVEYPLQNR